MAYNCGCLIVVMHRTFTTWQKYMNNLFFAVYPYPYYMSFLLPLRLWWNGGQKQAIVPEKRSPCITPCNHVRLRLSKADRCPCPAHKWCYSSPRKCYKIPPTFTPSHGNDFMLKITYFHMRCSQFPLELCIPSFLTHSAYHKPWLLINKVNL